MEKTQRRFRFLTNCSFKEKHARNVIKAAKKKIKTYKHLLNHADLTRAEREYFLLEIRAYKYEVMAWKSLLTNLYCPFADLDELWK